MICGRIRDMIADSNNLAIDNGDGGSVHETVNERSVWIPGNLLDLAGNLCRSWVQL